MRSELVPHRRTFASPRCPPRALPPPRWPLRRDPRQAHGRRSRGGTAHTPLGAALLMLRPTQEVARGVVTALIPQPLLPPVVRQEKGSPRRAGWERRAGHAKWERRQRRAGSECRVLPFSCRTTGGRRGWGMRAVTTPRATSCVGRNIRRAAPNRVVHTPLAVHSEGVGAVWAMGSTSGGRECGSSLDPCG
jgi:hypothetical protein